MTVRGEVLDEAKALTEGDRGQSHGDPHDNLACAANTLNGLFGTRFDATDVALIYTILKMVRIKAGDPNHRDHYVDAAAYMAIAWECQDTIDQAFGPGLESMIVPDDLHPDEDRITEPTELLYAESERRRYQTMAATATTEADAKLNAQIEEAHRKQEEQGFPVAEREAYLARLAAADPTRRRPDPKEDYQGEGASVVPHPEKPEHKIVRTPDGEEFLDRRVKNMQTKDSPGGTVVINPLGGQFGDRRRPQTFEESVEEHHQMFGKPAKYPPMTPEQIEKAKARGAAHHKAKLEEDEARFRQGRPLDPIAQAEENARRDRELEKQLWPEGRQAAINRGMQNRPGPGDTLVSSDGSKVDAFPNQSPYKVAEGFDGQERRGIDLGLMQRAGPAVDDAPRRHDDPGANSAADAANAVERSRERSRDAAD